MNQPLAETLFWIAVVACVIAQLAILGSQFAARRAHKSELSVRVTSRRAGVAVIRTGLGVALTATWQGSTRSRRV